MSEIVEAVVARALGSTRFECRPRPPLAIQANRLYDVFAHGQHYIAKEYLRSDELTVAPEREYRALKLVAPLDIAPQSVFYAPALGPVVIYEFMAGVMWDRRPPIAAQLAQLAGLWLRMANVPGDGLWLANGYERKLTDLAASFAAEYDNYAAWAEVNYPPGREAIALCREVLQARLPVVSELEGRAPVLRFCRSDPRFANVITRPDGCLGLVDWEDSGLRDPARELADILTHPNNEDLLTAAEWAVFVEMYLTDLSRTDRDLRQRVTLYLALFPIWWLMLLMRRARQLAAEGRLSGWLVNGLPVNDRMRRYLARALAWPETDFGPHLQRLCAVSFFPA